MKTGETLALDKSKQRSVARKTKKLKKQVKSGKRFIRKEGDQPPGLIYVGHLPHGFYEDEIENYFKQFGKVTNVKVCRSKKNGNSKGYGYVEFANAEVAKIAAETMNNYVMFKKRVIAHFVPFEKRPKHIFLGRAQSTKKDYSRKRRRERYTTQKNQEIDDQTHLKQSKIKLKRLQNKLKKINGLGIKYNLRPVNVPEGLTK